MWVKGANKWYRHQSTWGILLLGLLPFLEEHSTTIAAIIPDGAQPYVSLGLAVIVAVLRFVRQAKLTQDVNDEQI